MSDDGKHVLIVDDSEDGIEICAEYLTHCGYRVSVATNGLEAVEKAMALRPDLILMDLAMPILDGWEATRKLRRDSTLKRTLIVALTAHTAPDLLKRAHASGCDLILTKPIVLRELAKTIETLLTREPQVSERHEGSAALLPVARTAGEMGRH